MKTIKITIIIELIFFMLFSSCDSVNEIDTQDLNNQKKENLAKEISKLVGFTLKDAQVRSEISHFVDVIDTYTHSISFSLLLGNEDITPYESRILKKLKKNLNDFQSFSFKEKLNEIFTERNNLFPLISSKLKQQNLFIKKQ